MLRGKLTLIIESTSKCNNKNNVCRTLSLTWKISSFTKIRGKTLLCECNGVSSPYQQHRAVSVWLGYSSIITWNRESRSRRWRADMRLIGRRVGLQRRSWRSNPILSEFHHIIGTALFMSFYVQAICRPRAFSLPSSFFLLLSLQYKWHSFFIIYGVGLVGLVSHLWNFSLRRLQAFSLNLG